MTYFFAEITDVFAGEANYSQVSRFKIRAASVRGALIRLNRATGLAYRDRGNGGIGRYDSVSGATCAFVEEWDEDHDQSMHVCMDMA
jgi:hypothetical protein